MAAFIDTRTGFVDNGVNVSAPGLINVPAGGIIIAMLHTYPAGPSATITDSTGQTWVKLVDAVAGPHSFRTIAYASVSVLAATPTVSASWAGLNTAQLTAFAYSGPISNVLVLGSTSPTAQSTSGQPTFITAIPAETSSAATEILVSLGSGLNLANGGSSIFTTATLSAFNNRVDIYSNSTAQGVFLATKLQDRLVIPNDLPGRTLTHTIQAVVPIMQATSIRLLLDSEPVAPAPVWADLRLLKIRVGELPYALHTRMQ